MSAKIKIFELSTASEQEINDFLETNAMLKDGLIISEGKISFMYKTKEEAEEDKEKNNILNDSDRKIIIKSFIDILETGNEQSGQDGIIPLTVKLYAEKEKLEIYEGTDDGKEMIEKIIANVESTIKTLKIRRRAALKLLSEIEAGSFSVE